jgi:hypothetical protein
MIEAKNNMQHKEKGMALIWQFWTQQKQKGKKCKPFTR